MTNFRFSPKNKRISCCDQGTIVVACYFWQPSKFSKTGPSTYVARLQALAAPPTTEIPQRRSAGRRRDSAKDDSRLAVSVPLPPFPPKRFFIMDHRLTQENTLLRSYVHHDMYYIYPDTFVNSVPSPEYSLNWGSPTLTSVQCAQCVMCSCLNYYSQILSHKPHPIMSVTLDNGRMAY